MFLIIIDGGDPPQGPAIGNPMGARALYLYQVRWTWRSHGAIHPRMIGEKTTAGCICLLNIEVIHLACRSERGW
jgi:lipoprotein-anchoring transpeptidase ErfK/SrfK